MIVFTVLCSTFVVSFMFLFISTALISKGKGLTVKTYKILIKVQRWSMVGIFVSFLGIGIFCVIVLFKFIITFIGNML